MHGDTYDPARALCAAILLQAVQDHDWRFLKTDSFAWLLDAAEIGKTADDCRAMVERRQAARSNGTGWQDE